MDAQQVDHVTQLGLQGQACMLLVRAGRGDAPGLSLFDGGPLPLYADVFSKACTASIASVSVMQAPGWPRSSSVCHRNKEPIPVPTGPTDTSRASATVSTTADDGASVPLQQLLGSCIEAAADALIANAAQLDELDRAVGDGDCGSTLATAARAVKQVPLRRGQEPLDCNAYHRRFVEFNGLGP